jgi:peptidoglycan/LPS O-acetylase OafA/YrhL
MDYWRAALLFYMNFTAGPQNFAADPQWYVGHFWTLAVEEHFYSVWPAFLQFEKKQRRLIVAVSVCLFLAVWRCLNIKFSAHMATIGLGYFQHQGRTDFIVDRILWGAVVALAYSQYSGQNWVRRLLTAPVAVAMSVAVVGSFVLESGWKIGQALLFIRMILIPVILLTTILNCRGILAWVLENPLLKWVGRLSYSLYLWNQLFLVWGMPNPSRVPWPHRWPNNMACTFGCAIVSYYVIGRHFIKLGHRVV